MARNVFIVLAVGVLAGALAGGAAADYLGVNSSIEQGLQPSSPVENFPESDRAEVVGQESDEARFEMQTGEAIETGALSAAPFEGSWMKEYGHD